MKSARARHVMGLTALIVLAESLAGNILLPFVVFMVRSFRQTREESMGFWCGVLSTLYGYIHADETHR